MNNNCRYSNPLHFIVSSGQPWRDACGNWIWCCPVQDAGPEHGINFRMRRHDGAGMDWARELYAEIQREEGSEDSDDHEWHEFEEWPRMDDDFVGIEAEVQQQDGKRIYERAALDGGGGDAEALTDTSIFEPQALHSTRGGLAVPAERTGASNEAESEVAAIGECFLCGEEGCDCQWR